MTIQAIPGQTLRAIVLTVVIAGGGACGSNLTSPLDPSADLTVLFIGNSLTASNNLPSLTRAIAAAAGRTLSYETRAVPDASLEEHWQGGALDRIATARADVVVLQQGPSSLPESQQHLRFWTEQFAGTIRAAGGTPALLMVWPDVTRPFAFDDVYASYRGAADAVNGIFIPAGDAWRAVWRLDPQATLYAGDGFHPSPLGSLVAAITVYAVLFDADVRTLPQSLAPDVPPARFGVVLEAVHEAVLAARASTP